MQKEIKYVIDTRNLEFRFNQKNVILKDINLKVEKRSIYGFLGPNGAGKSTMIRLLLGLLKKRNGTINLFGKTLNENRIEILSKIGALIDQPSLYEHLSGYDNLEITRQLKEIKKENIKDVLQIVRLSDVAGKKVKAYSFGMKQRLGIAIALLGQPELLILDEPVNGLDPNGIMEMREVLKAINRKFDTTILLSSHLISEMEKLATHIGIINMGELVFQGTIDELYHQSHNELHLHLKVRDLSATLGFLERLYTTNEIDNEVVVVVESEEQASKIIQQLVSKNINIFKAVIEKNNLEQLFLKMTANYFVR